MSAVEAAPASRRRGAALRYALFVGVPLAVIVLMLRAGAGLVPSGAAAGAAAPAVPGAPLHVTLLLAQIIVIVALSRLAGALMVRIGQPRVVGEMAAGIVLGPSVLGLLAPGAFAMLFPAGTIRFLNALSQVGLVFFMFLVGLELDPSQLRSRGETALLTSHTSIVVPFALGTALSLLLYPRFGPAGVPFATFALFTGAAMSVTAFPVLARIISERGLANTRLGALAVASAAVDDVSAWCILAAIVMVAHRSGAAPLWLTVGGGVGYAALAVTVGRRVLARLAPAFDRHGRITQDIIAVTVLLVLVSAWVTQRLGLHAVFGAFLSGAVLPRHAGLQRALIQRFEDVMVVLLLPLFFAVTGLGTAIGLIGSAASWALCAAIVAVAVAGKLGGSAAAAGATGSPVREALALGALMNARGLMELVILRVGLDIGVITPVLFTMMVLMALVTTLMTTPLLAALAPKRATTP